MKRKIIQLAKNTLVVSIPHELVKKYNIKKKDEVSIIENGESMTVRFDKKLEEKKIEINIDEMNKKLVKDLLFFANTLGYDEITLKYNEDMDLSFLEDLTNQIEGLAIMNQTETSSNFKHISEESSEQFDEVLGRAFEVTSSLADSLLKIIKKENYARLNNLVALENSNNKLTSHCSRILIKGDYKDPSKTPFLFTLNWNLEIIADFYRRICWDLTSNNKPKKKLSPKTIKSIKMVNNLFHQYQELFKKLSTKGIIESFKLKNEIGVLVGEIFNEKKGIDINVAHYVMDIATFIQDSISLLLAINKLENER